MTFFAPSTVSLGYFSQLATGSLVSAVWQGILVATAAGLVLRLLPKLSASIRFVIWFGVFLLVTALPMGSFWPQEVTGHVAGRGAWLTLDSRWCVAIVVLWISASLWRAAQLLVAAYRVRELWRTAVPVDRISTAANERKALLCVSDKVDRPTVIGFFAPRILMPEWLLSKLSAAELEQIVLHESGHLGRADDWMNLLQKLALVVFPLNPALAWVERQLCFERELACDERVLTATGAPKAYATCLTTLAEYRLQQRSLSSRLALALGALGGRESELGRRVRTILRRDEGMKPLHAKLVLGGAMLSLLAAATGLEHCPALVGFSSQDGSQLAATRDVGGGLGLPPGYAYQSVVFHADRLRPHTGVTSENGKLSNERVIKARLNVPHSTLLKDVLPAHKTPSERPDRAIEAVARVPQVQRPARMENTMASLPNRNGAQEKGSDVVFAQWVTISSWTGADGSRVVLTTAETRAVQASPQTILNGAGQPVQAAHNAPTQQMYPYAAVPVRDGWLVFQL
jgi:hypothetical protein